MDELFLNKIKSEIFNREIFIENTLEKAFGIPKVSMNPKAPRGSGGVKGSENKQVGDTIKRGEKEYRILEIDPTKRGWGRFKKLQAVDSKEKISPTDKKTKETPQKGISLREKVQLKDTIGKLKEKVGQKIQELTTGQTKEQPKIEETQKPLSTKEKLAEIYRPKKQEEPQESYEAKLIDNSIDYITGLVERLDKLKGDSPEAEKLRLLVKNQAVNINNQLSKKISDFKITSTDGGYEDMKNKVNELDDKQAKGIFLSQNEFKEFKQLNKRVREIEESQMDAMDRVNQRRMVDEQKQKQQEIKNKLAKGQKLYGKKPYIEKPLQTTEEEKNKDLNTFVQVRYSNLLGREVTLDEVKKNNKDVVSTFIKQNGLVLPKGSKVNYTKGEISFPFDPIQLKKLDIKIKENYGKQSFEYFSLERGVVGGKSKIKIKKVEGNDWQIKPLPDKTLSDSINDLQKDYDLQSRSGRRITYKFEIAPGQYLTSDPSAPGGDYLTFIQGDTRAGKGLTYGTMMNQALGSANGGIVKFYNFDPTGKFWSDMETANPQIKKQLEAKGMLGFDGVAKQGIKNLDEVTQAKAIKNYVDTFVNKYNEVYAEREALLNSYGNKGHVGLVSEEQIPEAIFNFDEVQNMEDFILTNTKLEDVERKQLLQKLSGVLATQKTNGKKRGITVICSLQNGFQSDELNRVSKTANNTLISLDGKTNVDSFKTYGQSAGLGNAIARASIGNAIKLTTGSPEQNKIAKTFAPLYPGEGTVKALEKKGK